MITFIKKGNTVELGVTCPIPWVGSRIFTMSWSTQASHYAGIVGRKTMRVCLLLTSRVS